ncbi:MAG: PspA/IM30 family protein [Acidobacteria bacterium]|nr:MAG: PspA/IM30 family protein [Acidobacteriota bacterium]
MSIFRKLFKIFQSEAHAAVEELEDPIKLTEQGIRDLKSHLREALASLAQVKSVAVRLKKDAEHAAGESADYERKAMLLLKRMQAGELEAAEAERLASAALEQKEAAAQRAARIRKDYQVQQAAADKLQAKVEKLRRDVERCENELVTLRARARTAASMKKINQQLAGVDETGTLAMLERMKERVLEEESLAEAYGELAGDAASLDDKIDAALGPVAASEAGDSLADLKRRMGIES